MTTRRSELTLRGDAAREARERGSRALDERRAAARLCEGDGTLFGLAPDGIKTRTGWLDAPRWAQKQLTEIHAFANEVRSAGLTQMLLLGMGGSSLFPEAIAAMHALLPQRAAAPAGLPLRLVDGTDPVAVRDATAWADPKTTLFYVASKSGSTIETRSAEAHFLREAERALGAAATSRFVAITDPGSELGKTATQRGYRRVFENPADIGGRYSALSYFGLVPGSLSGVDIDGMIASAAKARASLDRAAGTLRDPEATMGRASHDDPGAALGALLGDLALHGRDKLTIVASEALRPFGAWIEQLVAESTGKGGRGIVPIDLEPLGAPTLYGNDRAFVALRLEGANDGLDAPLDALAAAGHPVAELHVASEADVGALVFRWEVATALASALLDRNPFDEPNVSEAKEENARLLEERKKSGRLPEVAAVAPDDPKVVELIAGAKAGDYVAISSFFAPSEARARSLEGCRVAIRARTLAPTMLGWGPRLLHSTGQLHKGGPNTGIFLVLTSDAPLDVEIPGAPQGFSALRDAQALGDLLVLARRGRRALRVHLGQDVEAGLEKLKAALERS